MWLKRTSITAIFLSIIVDIGLSAAAANNNYTPTWESLDSRPLPIWYDEAKIGIFVHWGVFSVPSFRSEWFWFYWKEKRFEDVLDFMTTNFPPGFTYQEFANDFKAEFFDADRWAELFKAAGARYVVLTTKHHEGFTLWPSKTSFSWNSVERGPRRDIVGELAAAVRRQNSLKFGVYHSLYEWYNPLWIGDKVGNFSSNKFATQKATTEMYDLVQRYHPDVFWSDGEAEATDLYWGSKEFLAWLYNLSPVRDEIVVNDRWGTDTSCKHGGFFNCADRFSPGTLQPHKWENALTIDRQSWGFRRNVNLSDIMTIEEILLELVQTVSCGGNILINVGPTKEGIIIPIFEERLRQLGEWLTFNGEAIYQTTPWLHQNDTFSGNVWYVQRANYVYGHILSWPKDNQLFLGSVQPRLDTVVELLTHEESLKIDRTNQLTVIHLPPQVEVKSKWVYVLRFTNL